MDFKLDVIFHYGNLDADAKERFKLTYESLEKNKGDFRICLSDCGFKEHMYVPDFMHRPFSYCFQEYKEPYNRSLAINNAYRNLAKGTHILVLDIDFLVPPTMIENIQEFYKRNKEDCFAVLSKARASKNKPRTNDYSKLVEGIKFDERESKNSSIFVCKNSFFESINGLDEDYVGWGAEDTDLNHRVRKTDKFRVLWNIGVVHQWHKGKDIKFIGKMQPYIDANTERYKEQVRQYNKGILKINQFKGLKDLRP